METLFGIYVLFGLCVRSFALPPIDYKQHALLQKPQMTVSSQHTGQQKAPAEERELVNTVQVSCHPDSLEILIKADMFGIGAPVNGDELRLGVEHLDNCRATMSSADEYKILVGLMDCGTKHWMTEDSLIYTNLLMYSPVPSPDGVVRMDEAVIPIECHYERKYSLSSSSLSPTWMDFSSTQSAVETLDFNLRIMTDDWQHQRSSNVFYLGESIGIEASVRVGHHVGLRVFLSSCVATLDPDIHSVPRYVFLENGCLGDSQLPDSKSHFLQRRQDDKLHLVIDAFRFHNEDRGQLYITCHLNAVPVTDAQAVNKACTFVNGRWRSVDGNDYLCAFCQPQNKPSSPGKFGPRGFGNVEEPEPSWRSGLKANTVWEQEAKVGPMLVLPTAYRSGPIPLEELPPVLTKISKLGLYGSRWRSGTNDKRVDLTKGLLDSTPEKGVLPSDDDDEDFTTGTALKEVAAEKVSAVLEKLSPEIRVKSLPVALVDNGTAFLDVSPTVQFTVVTKLSNETATESDLSDKNDPKR